MNPIEVVLANLNNLDFPPEYKSRLATSIIDKLALSCSATPEYKCILLEQAIVSLTTLEIEMRCEDYHTSAAALMLPRIFLTEMWSEVYDVR